MRRTRRRIKKNKTKRGGMMQSISSAVKGVLLPKPLTAEQQILYDKMSFTSKEKVAGSIRIDDVLQYTKQDLDVLLQNNKMNRGNLHKSIEIIKRLIKEGPYNHDFKLIKQLIQNPIIVGIVTPHLEKLNYYTDLSQSIVRMDMISRNKLINELYKALKNEDKLNLTINNEEIELLQLYLPTNEITKEKKLQIIMIFLFIFMKKVIN